MLKQPGGTCKLSLEHRPIESVLEVARSEFGYAFDDFKPAQIGGVAHGWPPIAAPDRNVKQLWMRPEDANGRFTVVGANCRVEVCGKRVRVDSLFEFGPVRKAVLARDDELSVAQTKCRGRVSGCALVLKTGMPPADTVASCRISSANPCQQIPGLALWDTEVRFGREAS